MSDHVTLAVPEQLRADARAMSEQAVEMLRLTRHAFVRQNAGLLQDVDRIARELHDRERAIIEPAVAIGRPRLAEQDLFLPMHLERVGDNIELLAGAVRKVIREGLLFTDRTFREINGLLEKSIELLENVRDVLATGNRTLLRYVLDEGHQVEVLANEYGLFHEQRLIEGVCLPKSSSVFLAMLDDIKGIEWHVRQIAQKLMASREVER